MAGRCTSRHCQIAPVMQLEDGRAEQNNLAATIERGRGSTTDCSAVGWVSTVSENDGDVTWADMGVSRNFMFTNVQ